VWVHPEGESLVFAELNSKEGVYLVDLQIRSGFGGASLDS